MPKHPAAFSQIPLAIPLMMAFWLILFFVGYPLPFVDDLYFIGAAVNMAHGGAFSNPFCPGLALLGARDHFFVYMPLHSYVLAGYLTITGISRASLAFFQALMGFISTLALQMILLRGRRDLFATLALCLSTAVFLGNTGLRPDALGLALFTSGVALLISSSNLFWLLGSICDALSVITSPNLLVLLPLAWIGGIFYLNREGRWNLKEVVLRVALLVLSATAAFLIFSVLIQFQFALFFKIFNTTRHMASSALASEVSRGTHSVHQLVRLFIHFGMPFLATMATLIVMIIQKTANRLMLALLLVAQNLLFLTAFSSGTGVLMLTYGSVLLALVLVLYLPESRRLAGYGGWLFFWCFFLVTIGYKSVVLLTFPPLLTEAQKQTILSDIAHQHPATVYVDEYAADELYDYRLPANTFDCHLGRANGPWNGYAGVDTFARGSVLVVSPEVLHLMNPAQRIPQFAAIPIFSSIYPHVSRKPFDLMVVEGASD